MKFFLEGKTFACSLQDRNLEDVFRQWSSNDYQVKKYIDSNTVLIRRKYASKTYGDALINLSFNPEEQLATIKVTPVPASYILFAIIPLSYVVLLAGKTTSYLYFLSPIVFLLFLIVTFKWNLSSNKNKFLSELRSLFFKRGIQFDFDK